MSIVCKRARKLSEIAPLLHGCHVVIEASPRGHSRPHVYRVSLQLSSGGEGGHRNAHASDANLPVALRDVFRATRRQLEKERHARGGLPLVPYDRHERSRAHARG